MIVEMIIARLMSDFLLALSQDHSFDRSRGVQWKIYKMCWK